MNDLQKQFEEETGLKSHGSVTDGVHIVGIDVIAPEYISWLEDQLTWRSIEEPPTEDGWYYCKYRGYYLKIDGMFEYSTAENKFLTNEEVLKWLPIPKLD